MSLPRGAPPQRGSSAAPPAPGGPDSDRGASTDPEGPAARAQLPGALTSLSGRPCPAVRPQERVGGQEDRKEWSQGAKSSQGGAGRGQCVGTDL